MTRAPNIFNRHRGNEVNRVLIPADALNEELRRLFAFINSLPENDRTPTINHIVTELQQRVDLGNNATVANND